MSVRVTLMCGLVFALAGCSGSASSNGGMSTSTGNSSSSAASDVSLPTCPLFDPADASFMGCGAARAYVNCTASNGGGMACLSNDPTQCLTGGAMASPGCSSSGGCASSFTCSDGCNADEFGVSCGAIGPSAGPSVPSTCRTVAPTPAGVVFACCPCGT